MRGKGKRSGVGRGDVYVLSEVFYGYSWGCWGDLGGVLGYNIAPPFKAF